MKIISWNVNGIRSVYRKGFVESIEKIDPDIICLQEIKSKEIPRSRDLFSEGLDRKYYSFINPAEKAGYSGTLVFSKEEPKKAIDKLGLDRFDREGRFQKLDFENFSLINIYVPHGARDKRNLGYKLNTYKRLIGYLRSNKNKKLVVCGDFNIAHTKEDLANPMTNKNNIMFTPEERKEIDKIIKLGYIDSFRKFHKGSGYYSWWPYRKGLRERNIGWRIDYIFIAKALGRKLKKAEILKNVFGSDHCPISVEI